MPGYTKKNFCEGAYYNPFYLPFVKLLNPVTGIIEAKKGDTINFKISCSLKIKDLQINSNIFRNPDVYVLEKSGRKYKTVIDSISLIKQQYVPFEISNSVLSFNYIVTENSLYYLEILFDRERVLRFKVVNPS